MPRIDRLFLDPIVSVGYFSDTEAYVDTTIKTNGLDLSLFWDNRDFAANPFITQQNCA